MHRQLHEHARPPRSAALHVVNHAHDIPMPFAHRLTCRWLLVQAFTSKVESIPMLEHDLTTDMQAFLRFPDSVRAKYKLLMACCF
jgi:hypothetical protein